MPEIDFDLLHELVYKYYSLPMCGAGGPLHLVLDDHNFPDSALALCYEAAAEHENPMVRYLGQAILLILSNMSPAQRWAWKQHCLRENILALAGQDIAWVDPTDPTNCDQKPSGEWHREANWLQTTTYDIECGMVKEVDVSAEMSFIQKTIEEGMQACIGDDLTDESRKRLARTNCAGQLRVLATAVELGGATAIEFRWEDGDLPKCTLRSPYPVKYMHGALEDNSET